MGAVEQASMEASANGARRADSDDSAGSADSADSADRAGNAGSADVLAARLASLATAVERETRAVLADRPEGVHDLRVAVRRVRSCLRTFRPVFERERAEQLRQELAWVATALGAARDPDVVARRLARRLDRLDVEERMGPVRRELVGGSHARAAAGRAAAVAALGSARYRRLLDQLGAFAASPPYRIGRSGCDPGALDRCVRKEIRRSERRASRAAAEPPGRGRDVAFHDVRKAAKRVRDAAVTVRPLAPAASHRLARRFETVQDVLGERQDAVVARRLLVQDGARVGVLPAHNGFTYGLLAEQERGAIRAVERRWPDVWRRATRKKLRRFLTP